jgi:DNA-binding transcriptional ArsR family regulator
MEETVMGGSQDRSMVVAAHQHPVDPTRVDHGRARALSAERAGRPAGALSLLADPVRTRILYVLDLVEELCAGDIALALGASVDSVGYGLRLLRTAGRVATREDGRVDHYRLAPDFPEPVREHCLRHLVDLSRSGEDPEGEE